MSESKLTLLEPLPMLVSVNWPSASFSEEHIEGVVAAVANLGPHKCGLVASLKSRQDGPGIGLRPPHHRFRIRALNGTKEQHALLLATMRQWSQHCGARFVFVDSNPSDCRVRFVVSACGFVCFSVFTVARVLQAGSGGYSSVGAAPDKNSNDVTMEIGEEPRSFCRTVLHETGHLMGFLHEHQHPDRPFDFKPEEAKEAYCCFPNDAVVLSSLLFLLLVLPASFCSCLHAGAKETSARPLENW